MFEHRVENLPEPRAESSVVTGVVGDVYIFGGTDDTGAAVSEAWRLAPSSGIQGVYVPLTSDESFARAGASAALHGQDLFAVAGSPPLFVNGLLGTVSPLADGAPAVDGTATSVLEGEAFFTLFAGLGSEEGGVLVQDGQVTAIPQSAELARTGHATVALPDNTNAYPRRGAERPARHHRCAFPTGRPHRRALGRFFGHAAS